MLTHNTCKHHRNSVFSKQNVTSLSLCIVMSDWLIWNHRRLLKWYMRANVTWRYKWLPKMDITITICDFINTNWTVYSKLTSRCCLTFQGILPSWNRQRSLPSHMDTRYHPPGQSQRTILTLCIRSEQGYANHNLRCCRN